MPTSDTGTIHSLVNRSRVEPETPRCDKPPPTAPANRPNAGAAAVVTPATASPYNACLPTCPQSISGTRPSANMLICANSDDPGMNNIWIAVLLAAARTIDDRRIVWMIVRTFTMCAAASTGRKNAIANATANSVIMKMNMTSAWRSVSSIWLRKPRIAWARLTFRPATRSSISTNGAVCATNRS
ncbi:hypothetical protein C5N14_29270 [Micromonospora sp. MW-13]|nr:hypothetical protein C5N14_29270 [Micromonospora sp. MW-13]